MTSLHDSCTDLVEDTVGDRDKIDEFGDETSGLVDDLFISVLWMPK